MPLRYGAHWTRSSRNSRHAGLLLTVSAFGAGPMVAANAVAQVAPELSETVQHVDLHVSRLHAGSTTADVQRVMGKPTAAELGGPKDGHTAAGRVVGIDLHVACVGPTPVPARARAIKAIMVGDGVTGLVDTPIVSQRRVEAGHKIEQMVFVRTGEPEFSVFLFNSLVVDVGLRRQKAANLTSMQLPTAVSDASVISQLSLGLNQTQVAALVGPVASSIHFTFKSHLAEYAAHHQRDGKGVVTASFIGGVLTASTLWPSDEL